MHWLCYLQYQVYGIQNHLRCRPLMVILIRLSDVGKSTPLRWYSFLAGTLNSYKAEKESWVQTSLIWDAMGYQLFLLCLPYIGGELWAIITFYSFKLPLSGFFILSTERSTKMDGIIQVWKCKKTREITWVNQHLLNERV